MQREMREMRKSSYPYYNGIIYGLLLVTFFEILPTFLFLSFEKKVVYLLFSIILINLFICFIMQLIKEVKWKK